MSGDHWVIGIHAVEAVLRKDRDRVRELLIADNRHDRRTGKLAALAREVGVSLRRVSRGELDALVDGNHQGVAARCEAAAVRTENELPVFLASLSKPALLLVLDGVTDPHNLGACLRSADAAGVDAVIVPKDHCAPITPVVRKVASGAAETVPLFVVTNLARCLRTLQEAGLWLVGAAGEADAAIYDLDFTVPVALVLGAEGSGMRRLTREHCDYLASIPLAGSVSSLNVSVAAGVCLFEALRQRRR